MNKKIFISDALILFVVLYATGVLIQKSAIFKGIPVSNQNNAAAVTAVVKSPFLYAFSVDGILNETGNAYTSASPYWWLDSGGQLILKNGVGETIQGDLSPDDKWRVTYSKSNPTDTDGGYHPQNIFRLITRSTWKNYRQQAYFNIKKIVLSESYNRNESNGILLLSRYKDEADLYYAGVRVDGYAVIKKKINNVYYLMDSKNFIKWNIYNRDTNPNLLPLNVWIGVRSDIKTLSGGDVSIKLYTDQGKTGNWTLTAEAIDDNKSYGGAAISDAAYAGIRTDFMDVIFDDYYIAEI